MYEILIIDDNLENCDTLICNFEKISGYRHTIAHNSSEALAAVNRQHYDLILLEVVLPASDGIGLCVQIRKNLYCPIIFMSCVDDEETIVHAMRMGGDYYITKPFRFQVLLAHIEAALRRIKLGSSRTLADFAVAGMVLSTKEHLLIKGDKQIFLSPMEFELLTYFLNNENVVLGFEEIYQYIWQKPSLGDLRTEFSHIRNLRKKIEDNPSNPHYITTVPRVGYVFSTS